MKHLDDLHYRVLSDMALWGTCTYFPNALLEYEAIHALASRGLCLVAPGHAYGFGTACFAQITPRGRLARRCHEAARGQPISDH